jgi:hypothetical protein
MDIPIDISASLSLQCIAEGIVMFYGRSVVFVLYLVSTLSMSISSCCVNQAQQGLLVVLKMELLCAKQHRSLALNQSIHATCCHSWSDRSAQLRF